MFPRLKHIKANFLIRRISTFQKDRLIRLEEMANRKPSDAMAQEMYQRELIKQGYGDLARARHESGRFATSERTLFSKTFGEETNNQITSPSISWAVGRNETEPMFVQMVEPSFRSKVSRAAGNIIGMVIVLFGFSFFLDSQYGGGGGIRSGGLSGKSPGGILGSKQYEVLPSKEKKTFNDVKGAKEVTAELSELVEYLKNPSKFTRLGGKLPKGVLLTGNPGVGKTLLAKAIAGEANVPFFYASGSEFEETFVGLGAKRVRELFSQARAKAPCIVFIDEIDALASNRHTRASEYTKQTLNQLLVELDGFNGSEGVIIIAATNFPQTLDPALTRPGRIDRSVHIPLPDIQGRRDILAHYLQKTPKDGNIDIESLAKATTGMTGADLANLVNIAALSAATAGAKAVGQKYFEDALDRVLLGLERKSTIIPSEVRRCTAFHEGGHALVALRTEGARPLHRATIIPRGPALGFTAQLPEEKDSFQQTKQEMIANLDILMGGRVAEEIIFGDKNITSGAANDLQKATNLAREMVASYGMLPESSVGLSVVNKESASETQRLVDIEVRSLLDSSYKRVKALLLKHRKDLDRIASELLEKETLSGDDLRKLIQGE